MDFLLNILKIMIAFKDCIQKEKKLKYGYYFVKMALFLRKIYKETHKKLIREI
jgi:hypothetical protein